MGLTQVSTDGVKNDAITKVKIPANQIEASELADNAVDTNAIANNAVTAGKLASGVQTTINNNADNRVITGSGTANTLEGEANLTFDGSVLTNTGSTVIGNDIKSGTDDPFIYSYKGGSDGQVRSGIQLDGTNQRMEFYTGTNERMRIDSGGNVGVGTTSPESKFAVKGTTGASDLFSISDTTVPTTGAEYAVAMLKTGYNYQAASITNYSTYGQGLRIYNNGGAVGRDALVCVQAGGTRLTVNEDVTVNTGNLVIGTAGKGIDFSATGGGVGATSDDSELLNDYEEGSFQLGLSAMSVTAHNENRYVKIGNLVYVTARITLGTANNPSATVDMSGLPYAPLTSHSAQANVIMEHTFTNTSGGALSNKAIAIGIENTGNLQFKFLSDQSSLIQSNIGGQTVRFSLTYTTG